MSRTEAHTDYEPEALEFADKDEADPSVALRESVVGAARTLGVGVVGLSAGLNALNDGMEVIRNDVSSEWEEWANCLGVDPDLFFPEKGASTREAKEVCLGCTVRECCMVSAFLNVDKYGIWGGTSERERRRVRRVNRLYKGLARLHSPDTENDFEKQMVFAFQDFEP